MVSKKQVKEKKVEELTKKNLQLIGFGIFAAIVLVNGASDLLIARSLVPWEFAYISIGAGFAGVVDFDFIGLFQKGKK